MADSSLPSIPIDVIPLIRLPAELPESFTYGLSADDAPHAVRGAFVRIPFRSQLSWGVVAANPSTVPLPPRRIRRVLSVYPAAGLTETEIVLASLLAQQGRISTATAITTSIPLPPVRPVLPKTERGRAYGALSQALWVVKLFSERGADALCIYDDHESRMRTIRIAAAHALANRLSVLVMVPHRSWIDRIAIMLHPLPTVVLDRGEGKQEQWRNFLRSRQGPIIIVGTRSASCIAPNGLGLIVVDLAESDDHKSWDARPRYDARALTATTASRLAIPRLLLSSAPRVEEWEHAAFRFRVGSTQRLQPTVVDLDAHWRGGGTGMLPPDTLEAITSTLAEGRAVFVLHHRRGRMARTSCRDCQRVVSCTSCQRPLVEHDDGMRCHGCAEVVPKPIACPTCASPHLSNRGMGTRGVVELLARHFPKATIDRVDGDRIAPPRIDAHIIVGTERFLTTFAPLWKVPIGLLVVLHAERCVPADDFRAQERLFQLLRSVTVWMRAWNARAVIQSSDPTQPPLRAVAEDDIRLFYHHEIDERRALRYPPTTRLIRCDLPDRDATVHAIDMALSRLPAEWIVARDGPLPSRSKQRLATLILRVAPQLTDTELATLIRALPASWSVDLDPLALYDA